MNIDCTSAYIAFDVYPSSKGAATHIGHMAGRLFEDHGGGALITLGNAANCEHEQEGNVVAHRFMKQIPNYLERAQAFAGFVQQTLATLPMLEVLHYRDIWSAIGVSNASHNAATLFEVNGLPSIELPYHYPNLSKTMLEKLRVIEKRCLDDADRIMVPSKVIQRALMQRGVNEAKMSVIPNGATPNIDSFATTDIDDDYIVYFGAVQAWQGVDVLLRAMSLLQDLEGLKLVIFSASKPRQTKDLKRLARRLGIENNVIWKYQLDKTQLNAYISNAILSVAPLTECSRNLEQGCSPLKIFESMAIGTAVVASKIPAVEEILQDGVNGKLVRADRPQELARAIRLLLEYPKLRSELEQRARQSIEQVFNWSKIGEQLSALYATLK